MRKRRKGLVDLAVVLALSWVAVSWAADEMSLDALKKLDLSELLDMEVTSVSKKAERLSQTAAAVQVITREEIRRSGAATLPEVLRLATGVQVARGSGREWSIGARGFSTTAANKLQVMIDGRSVYTPLFSGVFWDVQEVLLEDVERIEIIRGPGAMLWGANAVNGVINIITLRADLTQGGLVSGGGGAEMRLFGQGRYGGALGQAGHYRVYGKYLGEDGFELSSGGDAGDERWLGQGGFRADGQRGEGEQWRLQGDYYEGRVSQLQGDDVEVKGVNVLGQWKRSLSPRDDLQVQFYLDRTERLMPLVFGEERNTWDLSAQMQQQRGRHEVVWGLAYRGSGDDVEDGVALFWEPSSRTTHLFSGFARVQMALLDERMQVVVGSELEHNSFTGIEVQPGARLGWKAGERQLLWGAVSRAVRTPTRIDTDIRVTDGRGTERVIGGKDFDSEVLLAYELGYRMQPREQLSLSLAAFYNDYDRLRSQEPTPPDGLPLVLANGLQGRAFGGEVEINYFLREWWRWRAGYAYLNKEIERRSDSADPTGGVSEGNDPEHQLSVRSALDLPGGVEADVHLRYVDSLPSPPVPSYAEADLRLGWRASQHLTLEAIGRNLLHGSHPEFGAVASRKEVQRSLYGRATWNF